MNISFVGLGKLGLPCALAIEKHGNHNVIGYDPSDKVQKIVENKKIPYREVHAQEYLNNSNITVESLYTVVKKSDIIFVAVQTPHDPKFEGTTRLPEERVNFDYTYLKQAIIGISNQVAKLQKRKTVVIISTVLPGTIEREVRPLMSDLIDLCYNPFFIAMGTTIDNFMNPEFVLFGVDSHKAANKAKEFYATLHNRPVFETTIENAELIKVMYNTYISSKIAIANTIMEICDKTPNTNCDAVVDALSLATDRLISPRYMRGGMGDGGGCHPRDNIALSWLSKKLNLSYDWFENIMVCREKQTEWLADIIIDVEKELPHLPIKIFGKAFKEQTNITTGSPSILLKNILEEKGYEVDMFDPHIDDKSAPLEKPAIYFIGTKHPIFAQYNYPKYSIIIDPWRYVPDKEGIVVYRLGE